MKKLTTLILICVFCIITSCVISAAPVQHPNSAGSILYARQTLPNNPNRPICWDLVLTRFPGDKSRSIFPGAQKCNYLGRIDDARFLADRRHVVILLHKHRVNNKDSYDQKPIGAVCLLDTHTGKWSYIAKDIFAKEYDDSLQLSPDRKTLIFAGPIEGSFYIWSMHHKLNRISKSKGWYYEHYRNPEWPGKSINPRIAQTLDGPYGGRIRFVWVDAATGRVKPAKWPYPKIITGLAHGLRLKEEKKQLILINKYGKQKSLATTDFKSFDVELSRDGRYIIWKTINEQWNPDAGWIGDTYYTFFDIGGARPQRIMPKSEILSGIDPPGIIAWGVKPDTFYVAHLYSSNVEEGPNSIAFSDYNRSIYCVQFPELEATKIGSIPNGEVFMDLIEDIPSQVESRGLVRH